MFHIMGTIQNRSFECYAYFQYKPWILMDKITGYKWINGLNGLIDLVDWVKIVWILMDNELYITKSIKIYNKQKFKSNI